MLKTDASRGGILAKQKLLKIDDSRNSSTLTEYKLYNEMNSNYQR